MYGSVSWVDGQQSRIFTILILFTTTDCILCWNWAQNILLIVTAPTCYRGVIHANVLDSIVVVCIWFLCVAVAVWWFGNIATIMVSTIKAISSECPFSEQIPVFSSQNLIDDRFEFQKHSILSIENHYIIIGVITTTNSTITRVSDMF